MRCRSSKEIDDINLRQRSRTANAAATDARGTVNEKVDRRTGAAFKPTATTFAIRLRSMWRRTFTCKGANVRVYHDPKAMVNAAAQFPTLDVDSGGRGGAGADIVLFSRTEWNRFVTLTRTSLGLCRTTGDESWMPATCWIRRSGAGSWVVYQNRSP